MSEISSIDHREQGNSIRSKSSAFSKFKKRFAAVKQAWGPLLPAKEYWDDEYNFPPGRWAGQGLDPSWWRPTQ
ncbi:hypothetical protein BDW62DRAFT_192839 [Aspergillus aurantiobrunneus]